jgi:tetraacyldisaccharide-1-P 4'-kinase
VKPYRLLSTDDPDRTYGEADATYHATMIEAASAFVQSDALFKTVVYDDGHQARELTDDEERLLVNVATMLGHTVEDAG